jgi:multisubunit Na+/H+ antiporter MnhE subunit
MEMDDVDLANPMGMLSHFSISQIIASLIFSVIGIYVFRHGKKTTNYPLIFTAIAMMAYPLFTKGWLQDWGVGLVLCGIAYYFNENHNLTG